jgi:glyoxylase-like metal-dependent hydrolase (beta-lactamase superfamily II)
MTDRESPAGDINSETLSPARPAHGATAQEGLMPISKFALERPLWLVDSLGSLGVPFSRVGDFVSPPESSHGALFLEDRVKKGYHAEEIADGVYWVTSGWYDCMFIRTGAGVIAVDAPPALGELLLTAIEDVTDEPVTHFIYSHWHADHVGAAAVFGSNVKRFGHEKTRELLLRFPDPNRPAPTETFATHEVLDVNVVKVDLSYKGQNHCEGNIFIYVPKPKVLAAIDIASPGWVTFRDCDASENFSGYVEAFEQILTYDFTTLISGHVSKLGGREDVLEGKEYMDDLAALAREALETVEFEYFAKQLGQGKYSAAFRWVEEQYFAACTNYVTKIMLEKKTSNGKTWAEWLNAADVMTKRLLCVGKDPA